MKYRLIIFDFDGTLANTFPWVLGILDQVADHFKFERLTADEVEILRGSGAGKILKKHQVPFWKMPFIARHVRKLMAAEIDQIHLFPGAAALLENLARRGIQLGLVTTNARANVQHVLGRQHFPLIQYLECGVSIFGKQSKYRAILRRSGISPTETLCIGDELRDMDSARKAGIPFGAVTWGYTRIGALLEHNPAEVFSTMEEIEKICS